MNTCLSVLAVSAVLVAGVALTPIYAQGALEVMTDKTSYTDGETVQVTGQVGQILRGFPVALQVLAPPPHNNIVQVEQLTVAGDGTFAADIVAGKQWRTAGDYTVMVYYGEGGGQQTAMTTISFGGSSGIVTPTPPAPQPDPAPGPTPGSLLPPGSPTYAIDGSDVSVGYSITGGSLTSIMPDEASNSIVIGIDADGDGTLIIDFPREVLDARADGCSGNDDAFIVLVDGEERDFAESIADASRSLSITFEAGASQIEIIGTCVIPEFGTIAVMILAVAVVAIVAMTARSRLSILSRY